LVWASAAEGARFASETSAFVEEIRKLGPLNWGKPVVDLENLQEEISKLEEVPA
jgi:hypothetical protein